MSRPAVKVAIPYIVGILLGYYLDLSPELLLIGGCSCLVLYLLLRWKSPASYFIAPILMAGLILTGFLRYEFSTSHFPSHHIVHYLNFEEPLTARGRIVRDPELQRDRTLFPLEVTELGLAEDVVVPVKGRVLVKVRERVGWLSYGDRVELIGRLYPPPSARNPGAFNYRRYLERQGIFGLMTVRWADRVGLLERGKGNPFYSRVVLPVKHRIVATVDEHLSGVPAALLKGILLGEKRSLPREVREAFSDAGVIHVLAVSGLHVGLVGLIFLTLFQALRFPRGWVTLLTLAVIVLYMLITDLRPSVVRASIMAGVVLGGLVLERSSDIFNSIAFAGLLILLFSPQSLFEVGFQLSFVATLAIVYLYHPIRGLFPNISHRGWRKWLFGSLAVSLAAQLGTTPIIAYYFHRLPLISPLANLVVVPLVGVVVALGFGTTVFGLLGAKLALAFNAANWLALSVLLKAVRVFAHFPWASLRVVSPSPFFLAGYFPLLILAARARDSLWARKGLVFLVLIWANLWVWWGALGGPERGLEVTFLDVGAGEATFIRFPQGETLLIDGGPRYRGFDGGERVVAPYLEHLGVKRLNRVVLTNPYNRYVGGLPTILEDFPVDEVVDGGQVYPSRTYEKFLSLIAERGIPRRVVRAGEEIGSGLGVGLFVLHPTDEFVTPEGRPPYGVSNGSLVLRLIYGEVSFLFLGGIGERAQKALLRYGPWLRSTVVKMPCAKAGSFRNEQLLGLIQPKVAIMPGARASRAEALFTEEGEVRVYRTERDGAIRLWTDGRKLKVETTVHKSRDQYP